MTNDDNIRQLGKAVIKTELRAIKQLEQRIDESFVAACHLILGCNGRVVVTGMGKSGHIAHKIAATFASTGTAAFFVHPAEASHGDIGMITPEDVVLAISYSGETNEVINLLPTIKRLGTPIISMTSNPASILARSAKVNLDISVTEEACPLGLAPTSSTSVTMVLGDAIAIALLEARGFTSEDFARVHPGGTLGRRLLLHVDDVMHIGDSIPKVSPDCLLDEALVEITKKSFGVTTIVDNKGKLLGIFTDGDLRRTLDRDYDIHTTPIKEVMTKNSISIRPKMLAAEALQIMQKHKITSLIVLNKKKSPIGLIHMHDLLRVGVI